MKWDNSFSGIEYYSNVKSSSVEWIWYPYIPCGKITILQGDPGEGKSTLILHIAAILTKGATLPDGNKIQNPMTVIYQCSEDSKGDTIKPRLERAGADCRKVAFIKDDDGDLTLDDERIELAVKMTGARLLVLDPIQAFIGKNGNMQSAVRMRETMTKLANIASEYACAIVLVGHMNKTNGGKNIYRGLGSIDIAAAARSVLLVARDKDEPSKRYMLPIKSTFTPNYLDHKAKKNRHDRNQYRQSDHHEAIVDRDIYNAAQKMLTAARYAKKGFPFPNLKVVDEGALKGFVSVNRSWTGFTGEDYEKASQSAYSDQTDIDDTEKEERKDSSFDLSGYEIVRAQFFSTRLNPAMTISEEKVTFNTACLKKFENVEYVEILFNSVEKCIAVRPCDKDDINAVKWGTIRNGKWAVLPKSCKGFSEPLFDLMNWNDE